MDKLPDIMKFFKFEEPIGRKLIKFAYYGALIIIAGNFFAAFISGMVLLFTPGAANILAGLGRIVASPFVAAFLVLIARVLAEYFQNIWDLKEK